jgi:3-oxoacyl-[acyl-carrier protein] reductase
VISDPSSSGANRLDGLVAAVTGSSSGMGAAIARELAEAGADVLVHGFSHRERAELVATEIRGLGRKSQVVLADLGVAADRSRFASEAWDWQGRLAILVNCAGADVLTGDAAHWPFEKKLERLWQVDVLGTIELSRSIGQQMRDRESKTPRVILNIGWDQAEQGMAADSGQMFGAVKGAVMAFSRSLAQTLAPQVRVNCLCPGWIRTAWGEQASEYWQERAQRQALVGRWGTPEDVARVAAFICSPAADFVAGQVVNVNGGFRYE